MEEFKLTEAERDAISNMLAVEVESYISEIIIDTMSEVIQIHRDINDSDAVIFSIHYPEVSHIVKQAIIKLQ